MECLPTQRSLGVCWNLHSDEFTFRVAIQDKPFTHRGVLSSINILFDPLRLTAPVMIAGKSLRREAMTGNHEWDAPLRQITKPYGNNGKLPSRNWKIL
jgi:hypothetical protein